MNLNEMDKRARELDKLAADAFPSKGKKAKLARDAEITRGIRRGDPSAVSIRQNQESRAQARREERNSARAEKRAKIRAAERAARKNGEMQEETIKQFYKNRLEENLQGRIGRRK